MHFYEFLFFFLKKYDMINIKYGDNMKCNNQGFTVVELVLSFTLLSILVIGMLGVVLQYRSEVKISNRELDLVKYKDTLTKTIQDDIIHYGIQNVSYCKNASGQNTTSCLVLTFRNSTTKMLQVSNSNVNNRYILYGNQRFPIEEVIKKSNPTLSDAAIHLPTNGTINLTTTAVGSHQVYKIQIPITAEDIAQDFGIFIVASNDPRVSPATE